LGGVGGGGWGGGGVRILGVFFFFSPSPPFSLPSSPFPFAPLLRHFRHSPPADTPSHATLSFSRSFCDETDFVRGLFLNLRCRAFGLCDPSRGRRYRVASHHRNRLDRSAAYKDAGLCGWPGRARRSRCRVSPAWPTRAVSLESQLLVLAVAGAARKTVCPLNSPVSL